MPNSLTPLEYWCFISYRHADNKEQDRHWATWLQQEIERYEVPAEIVGTVNRYGETIPAKIYPVFRDEESLAADAQLGRRIAEALNASRCLVVLCSPSAVESKYVTEEIEHFVSLGRRDRIVPIILSGEPGDKERDCFPRPLRSHPGPTGHGVTPLDPLAADFRLRDGTEGWTSAEAYRRALLCGKVPARRETRREADWYESQLQLMKLKVISGILGLPLEKLRDRDKAYQLQRSRSRMRALTMWLLVVTACGVAALWFGVRSETLRVAAEKARKEAVQAQNDAEKSQELESIAKHVAQSKSQELTRSLSAFALARAIEYRDAAEQQYALASAASALRIDPSNQSAKDFAVSLLTRETWYLPEPSSVRLNLTGDVLNHDGSLMMCRTSEKEIEVIQTSSLHEVVDRVSLESAITTMCWHPRQDIFAVGCENGTALLRWIDRGNGNGDNKQVERSIGRRIHQLHFTADGSRIAVVLDGGIAEFYDTKELVKQGGIIQTEYIETLAFSLDGNLLATSAADGTITVWDAKRHRAIGSPLHHDVKAADAGLTTDGRFVRMPLGFPATGRVNTVEFHPFLAGLILTAGVDQTVRLWQSGEATSLGGPLYHAGEVISARFCPNGTFFASISLDRKLRYWGPNRSLMFTPLELEYYPTDIVFSRDGEFLACSCGAGVGRGGFAQVFADDGRKLGNRLEAEDDVESVELFPREHRVLTTDIKANTRSWRRCSWESGQDFFLREWPAVLSWAEFDTSGRYLACSWENGQVSVLDVTRLEWVVGGKKGFESGVNQSVFVESSCRVASACEDGRVTVWTVDAAEPDLTLVHSAAVTSIAMGHQGKLLIAGCRNGSIGIWNLQSTSPKGMFCGSDQEVESVKLSSDGTKVLVDPKDLGGVTVIDAVTGEMIRRFGEGREAAFTPDGEFILVSYSLGLETHSASLYNIASGEEIAGTLLHDNQITSVNCSPDGKFLLTSSLDRTVRVWNREDGTPVGPPLAHEKAVFSARFSPDSRLVVSNQFVPGEGSGHVQVWDIKLARLLSDVVQSESGFNDAFLSPSGKWLITLGGIIGLHGLGFDCQSQTGFSVPDWFPDFLEKVAGYRVAPNSGNTEAIFPANRDLRSMQTFLIDQNASGILGELAEWFLSPSRDRSISPYTTMPPDRWIQRALRIGDEYHLRTVLQLRPEHAEAWAKLAEVYSNQSRQRKMDGASDTAEFEWKARTYARTAMDLDQGETMRKRFTELLGDR